MGCIFHSWTKFIEHDVNEKYNIDYPRYYRHCKKCDEWQFAWGNEFGCGWQKNTKPHNISKVELDTSK